MSNKTIFLPAEYSLSLTTDASSHGRVVELSGSTPIGEVTIVPASTTTIIAASDTGRAFRITTIAGTIDDVQTVDKFDGADVVNTGANIKTLYEAEADTNAFDDAAAAKLANIEASATADQTGAEIKAAYEAEANAYTDAKDTKLSGIEAGADVTDETNVVSALDGAALTAVTVAGTDKVLVQDVDDSNNLKSVTAQSIADLAAGGSWGDVVDADIIPDADGTRDLGATATRFAETYTDALDVTNNITVGGTVDGRDLATDGTKLDGIEALADVTDETNVVSALDGATLTGVTVAGTDKVLVQDVSDTDNIKTVTAQSIADLAVGGGGGAMEFVSSVTLSTDTVCEFTGLDLTDKAEYVIMLRGIYHSTNASIRCQWDNAGTYRTVNYTTIASINIHGVGTDTAASNQAHGLINNADTISNTSFGSNYTIRLFGGGDNMDVIADVECFSAATSGNRNFEKKSIACDPNINQLTKIKFWPTAGTFDGEAFLYKINQS